MVDYLLIFGNYILPEKAETERKLGRFGKRLLRPLWLPVIFCKACRRGLILSNGKRMAVGIFPVRQSS